MQRHKLKEVVLREQNPGEILKASGQEQPKVSGHRQSAAGQFAEQGIPSLAHSALRPATSLSQVAEVYFQGKMSTLDLIDRYSQAHCWCAGAHRAQTAPLSSDNASFFLMPGTNLSCRYSSPTHGLAPIDSSGRYTLAQKAGDPKVAAAATKRIASLVAKRAPWPLSLLRPPLCNEDCLADSEDVCQAPLRERESLLVHPDDIRRKRRRLRRHRSHEHHPHDEF